jgi:heptosyltransferase II
MKILIIRLSSLGDIVLTQPVPAILRRQFPDAQIDYITKNVYTEAVEAFGCIDHIFVYKTKDLFLELRKGKYDMVIDLHSKLNTFIIKTIVGGKKTVTYDKKPFLRRKMVKGKSKQQIESTVGLYFSALKKIGLDEKYSNPELYPKSGKSKLPVELKSSDKVVGIFPGALHQTKRYPLKQLAEVINILPEEYNFVIFGSKDEMKDSAELNSLAKREVTDLCGTLSIAELIATMNDLDLVISNDSGPMHIAAALQKNQIALFGATHPILGFSPMNINATVICKNISCQPCSLHGSERCPKGHFDCMNKIKPIEIAEESQKILS